MERSSTLRRLSRLWHWIGEVTARSVTVVIVATVLILFGAALAVDGFPSTWETTFSTVVEAVALLMLFVIQHTQSRHQLVLQLKLDELIRATPRADDLLVQLEAADDAEVIEVERSQRAHHDSVRENDALAVIEFPHRQ